MRMSLSVPVACVGVLAGLQLIMGFTMYVRVCLCTALTVKVHAASQPDWENEEGKEKRERGRRQGQGPQVSMHTYHVLLAL